MGKNTKIVGGVLLVAIILVAVAYAAITNVELNINGVGSAQAKQENFKVEFIGTPSTSGKGTTTATINSDDKTQGEVNVTGLTAKGDEAVAIYTVKNLSSDISADLTAEATSSNQTYFEVICSLEKTTLKAQEETTLKVTVRLLKTPIDETKEDLNSDIDVTLTADPKQPGEEANGGSTSVSSNETRPYLPTGFTQVKGTTLKSGLTIQDSTGNQYVWVEVPKAERLYKTAGLNITDFTDEEYTKIEDDLHTYTNDYRDGTSYKDEYYSGVGLTSEEYYSLKKMMLKSVYQNGGFYVGKYETGVMENPRYKESSSATVMPTDTPVIKQNAYPYNNITCSQAQTLASNMESGNHTSSLMFGVQWDLVLKYLETKGTAQADLTTNSTSWGNYMNNKWNITNVDSKYYRKPNWTSGAYGAKGYTGVLLSTGASEEFGKQGIYDLAGNVYEWTLEKTSNSGRPCAVRGGDYVTAGGRYPAANRDYYGTTGYAGNFGFRVSLF